MSAAADMTMPVAAAEQPAKLMDDERSVSKQCLSPIYAETTAGHHEYQTHDDQRRSLSRLGILCDESRFVAASRRLYYCFLPRMGTNALRGLLTGMIYHSGRHETYRDII